jgi:hypothetical protein
MTYLQDFCFRAPVSMRCAERVHRKVDIAFHERCNEKTDGDDGHCARDAVPSESHIAAGGCKGFSVKPGCRHECSDREQTAIGYETGMCHATAETTHQMSETQSQLVAILQVCNKSMLSGMDNCKGRRAAMNLVSLFSFEPVHILLLPIDGCRNTESLAIELIIST